MTWTSVHDMDVYAGCSAFPDLVILHVMGWCSGLSHDGKAWTVRTHAIGAWDITAQEGWPAVRCERTHAVGHLAPGVASRPALKAGVAHSSVPSAHAEQMGVSDEAWTHDDAVLEFDT